MAGLTTDDLVFFFENKLACRHVSGKANFERERNEVVQGDGYAIGAANILAFPAEERANDKVLGDAVMKRVAASFSGGPNEKQVIVNGGSGLVQAYKAELRKMVAAAVDYDVRHGKGVDCHFLVYRDHPGAAMPYDVHKYPFGKCGKGTLKPEQIVAAIGLNEQEVAAIHGNQGAIVDTLATKLFSALQEMRVQAQVAQVDGKSSAWKRG